MQEGNGHGVLPPGGQGLHAHHSRAAATQQSCKTEQGRLPACVWAGWSLRKAVQQGGCAAQQAVAWAAT